MFVKMLIGAALTFTLCLGFFQGYELVYGIAFDFGMSIAPSVIGAVIGPFCELNGDKVNKASARRALGSFKPIQL